jgi:hypothetical protein
MPACTVPTVREATHKIKVNVSHACNVPGKVQSLPANRRGGGGSARGWTFNGVTAQQNDNEQRRSTFVRCSFRIELILEHLVDCDAISVTMFMVRVDRTYMDSLLVFKSTRVVGSNSHPRGRSNADMCVKTPYRTHSTAQGVAREA